MRYIKFSVTIMLVIATVAITNEDSFAREGDKGKEVVKEKKPIQEISDTARIDPLYVNASLKETVGLRGTPLSYTKIGEADIERHRVISPKELSIITPNLYMPDYGSKMTSSIYIRGIGARIDQPAVGLYVDNVPYMNKNNYDIDFYDIASINVLSGPQGTLYGRNTVGGVISIYTLSPEFYQGIKASVDYGSWNTLKIKASLYNAPSKRYSWSAAGYYKRSDGAYTNNNDGSKCEKYRSGGARLREIFKIGNNTTIENILTADLLKQDGYPYAQYNTSSGETMKINYNNKSDYRRFTLTDGLSVRYSTNKIKLSSTTTWQYTNDKMNMDQDFLPASYYTLIQEQHEHTFTQDITLSSNADKKENKIQWLAGIFGFHKNLRMDAPVVFGQDGINEFILKGANAGIHTVMPMANLVFRDSELPINSNFTMPTSGLAGYGQASIKLGGNNNTHRYWTITAGIRFDYEHASMSYDNVTKLAYKLTPMMQDYKEVSSELHGTKRLNFNELLPKISIMYNLGGSNLYFSITKGYKAGGFNTQIFSDILQTKLMSDLMGGFGSKQGSTSTVTTDYEAKIAKSSYKPEHSWNFELGSHFQLFENKVNGSASLFYIGLRNQQITVFPEGKTTGRMMSNAGRSYSKGAEISLSYAPFGPYYNNTFLSGIKVSGSFGHTIAKFTKYNDGNNDYSHNYVPYAPRNTVMLAADFKIPLGKEKQYSTKTRNWQRIAVKDLSIHADYRGVGKIYWDETNNLSQPYYGVLSACIGLNLNCFTLSVYGKNLTDKEYNVFYFKSVGNSFVQKGRPVELGVSINFDLR